MTLTRHTGAAEETAPSPDPEDHEKVFRNRNFRRVFAAAAVSNLGTQISYLAVPLVAVLALNASAGEVGLLGTLSTAAFLLIGLPAGAWVDRARRKIVMVTADFARFLLFGSIPLAWWLGVLSIWQLYAVVLLAGVAQVFFDVANQSFLPHVVGRPGLVNANSALVSLDAGNQVAGRSAGGFLVQLLSAPAAVLLDSVSYLWSALCIIAVRKPEPKPERKPDRHLVKEVSEGVRFVTGQPVLRAIAIASTINNLSIQLCVTLLPVLFVRELHLSVGALGFYLAVGGIGVFVGARVARPLARTLGNGQTLWIVGIALAPFGFLLPLIARGPMLWFAVLAWLLTTFRVGLNNVIQVSFRQRSTPDHLLGRMNATMRFVLTGALAVGSALAGLLGEVYSVRTVLWVGAVGLALVWVPIFLSPLRTTRELPA